MLLIRFFSFILLQKNLLEPINDTLLEYNNNVENWEIYVVVFILSLFAIVQYKYNKVVKSIIGLLVFKNFTIQQIRDENIISKTVITVLSLNFILILTMSIFKTLEVYNIKFFQPYSFLSFLEVLSYVISFLIIKLLVISFLAHVFEVLKVFYEYILSIFCLNTLLSVFLFPFIVFMFYFQSKEFFIGFWGILITIMILISTIRGIVLVRFHARFSFIYLFLYLCTVEILPLLYIYVVFHNM